MPDTRKCHLRLQPRAITVSAVPLLVDYFEPVAKPNNRMPKAYAWMLVATQGLQHSGANAESNVAFTCGLLTVDDRSRGVGDGGRKCLGEQDSEGAACQVRRVRQ